MMRVIIVAIIMEWGQWSMGYFPYPKALASPPFGLS